MVDDGGLLTVQTGRAMLKCPVEGVEFASKVVGGKGGKGGGGGKGKKKKKGGGLPSPSQGHQEGVAGSEPQALGRRERPIPTMLMRDVGQPGG